MPKDEPLTPRTRVTLVTGPSGAGRSTAINALEDLGFEAIDNLPLSLLPSLISGAPPTRPLAIGIDARNRDFSVPGVEDAIKMIRAHSAWEGMLLYIDCSENVLLKRYSETRRRHPLAPEESAAIGIAREQDLLAPIKGFADRVLDTGSFTPHDLRAEIEEIFQHVDDAGLAVTLQSFAFKKGVPLGLDVMFDVRFLQNPYWVPDLRALDGRHAGVADYVAADPLYGEFFEKLVEMTSLLLPAYKAEGKSYFSVGLGCTGGQHRSVAVAESLAKRLEQFGWGVSIRHREFEGRSDQRSGLRGTDL